MKIFRNLLILSIAIAGFLMVGTAAKADTIVTLDAPFQTGPQSLFSFTGTITNTGDTTVYLNSDNYNVDSPGVFDDSGFFDSPYLSLAPGQSTPDFLLFTVTVPPYGEGSPSNYYAGYFQLVGGIDDNTYLPLDTVNFDITVTPEPSSYLLFGSGLLLLGFVVKSKLLA